MEKIGIIYSCRCSENISVVAIGTKIVSELQGNAGLTRGFSSSAMLYAFLLHETVRHGTGILVKSVMDIIESSD